MKNISESRMRTAEKCANMTDREFDEWIKRQAVYGPSGRCNGNVTRALQARKMNVDVFYSNHEEN